MKARVIEGIDVNICTNCAGTWLDGGKLRELTDWDITAGKIMHCLRCNTQMKARLIRGGGDRYLPILQLHVA